MNEHHDRDFNCYNASDFALDDSFIDWVKNPSGVHADFWVEWLESHPEKWKDVEIAHLIVSSLDSGNQAITQERINKYWNELDQSISKSNTFSRYFFSKGISSYTRIAAILLMVFSLSMLYVNWGEMTSFQNKSSYTINQTQRGQKLTVSLPDGSLVKLNSESQIEYLSNFSEDVREVKLIGEAFFDVQPNPNKPFIVKSRDFTATVLGTSFNLKSYPDSPNTELALTEGSVKINKALSEEDLYLKPGEMIRVLGSNKDHQLISFTNEEIGWTEGTLYFNKVDFDHALTMLERWFGVEFEVDDDVNMDSDWRFYGKFQNKSVGYLLQTMSYPDLFSFEINDNNQVKIFQP